MYAPTIFAGSLDENGDGYTYVTNIHNSVRLRSVLVNGIVVDNIAFIERYYGDSGFGSSCDMLMMRVHPKPLYDW